MEDSHALVRSRSYRVLNSTELGKLHDEVVQRVSQKFSITVSAANSLLRVVRFDEEDLAKKFKSGLPDLAKKAGVANSLYNFMQTSDKPDESVRCTVCFDDLKQSETFGMKCGHRFCMDCWKGHLNAALDSGTASGANALNTTCPGLNCKEVVGEEVYEMLVDAKHFKKYKDLQMLSFVDENVSAVWCPGKNCGRVIAYSKRQRSVSCVCGAKFCFKCKDEAHWPANCQEAREWLARDKGSMNLDSRFLMQETKPCPKCGVRVKKDGGCMFMSCTQCKTSWCWQCGKGDHHVWECNRPNYEASDSKDKDDVNRYLFYFERYFNHGQSLKIADKQRSQTIDKMKGLVAGGMHFKNVDFLLKGVELVMECRRVLKWTYVKAFHIKAKSERTLFEYRQSDLEKHTENLNKLTEGTIEQLTQNRLTILDWSRALFKYLDGIEFE